MFVEIIDTGFDGFVIAAIGFDAKENMCHIEFTPGWSLTDHLDDMITEGSMNRGGIFSYRSVISCIFKSIESIGKQCGDETDIAAIVFRAGIFGSLFDDHIPCFTGLQALIGSLYLTIGCERVIG